MVLENTLKSPLDCKGVKEVNPKKKRAQAWIFIGGRGAEAEAPILCPTDAKSWLIGKDPYAWKDWRQEEKVMTEDEIVWWHLQLNGHEFDQAPGDGKGQGSLMCWGPGVAKSQTWLSDWTTNASSIFSFLQNLHIILSSVCINLHSYQQVQAFPFLYILQHLLFVDFLMIAIQTVVRW